MRNEKEGKTHTHATEACAFRFHLHKNTELGQRQQMLSTFTECSYKNILS